MTLHISFSSILYGVCENGHSWGKNLKIIYIINIYRISSLLILKIIIILMI